MFDSEADIPKLSKTTSSAKRHKSDITGVYDNVQEALAAQPLQPEEPLTEESPKSVNYFLLNYSQNKQQFHRLISKF